MSKHFTHLHLHTEYSLLDGAIGLDRLVEHAKKEQLRALAMTDHGNVFGAVKFFEKCKKAGIKPILGMEAYFTEDVAIKTAQNKYYHLIILVQNEHGYKNLCKLISHSFKEGFYFKPRIDYALLERYSHGLIITSACLGGHIPSLLKDGNEQEAERRMDWFMRVFGPDRFYFEIQPEDQKEQALVNAQLIHWGQKKGIGLVATGDCHYVDASDREAHEVMLSIQTQHKLADPDRFTFGDCRVHMRSVNEMLACFSTQEQAIWQSGAIADMCSFEFQTGKLFFPQFPLPQEHTAESYFRQLCAQGLERLHAHGKIASLTPYQARLDVEMDLIVRMGFIGYFLVVSDFIRWAKRASIPVGPGRGSAAGSLVAWVLEITDIDPLAYNLLFERFLNPERITMPDIDIDFCVEGRERVIEYIRQTYGYDKVGQIITFGTMMAKGVVKDVARVLGIPFEDSNMITSLIHDQLKITLKEAIEQEPRLKSLVETNPTVTKLFDLAFRLEGLTRHASKHAAGVVISPEPIDEVLPVYVPAKSTELVTQYAMTELESLGFLKIDLLGLKNLTLIQRACQAIEESHGIRIVCDAIALDDAKTFALISAGNTSGVFQLESDGLKEVLRKLQPSKFEDIIAVNALYRPGPLGSGMVDDFIERRHGRQKIAYIFPELEPILQETYGIIVYQEQVMKIASTIAGYSLGESDILRRAMGKKKAEEMEKQRAIFLSKSVVRQFNEKKAGELFDLMAYFAGYGFNKSHSAAYALIAYHTAYLKAHYPAQFMACLLSLETEDPDKMAFYLQETYDMGLRIIAPDINTSAIGFTAQQDGVMFGLKGIKNVGQAALEAIIQERKNGLFTDLLSFCKRIDLRVVNKRVIENLICAGAFDTCGGYRSQKCNQLSTIIEQALALKRNEETGQMGLFEMAVKTSDVQYAYAPEPEWDQKTMLEKEKEVMGFYVCAHPLDSWRATIRSLSTPSMTRIAQIKNEKHTQEPIIHVCGLKKTNKVIFTKKNERMSFLQLEERDAKAEVIIFPRLFAKVEQWLENYSIFVVKGTLDLAAPGVKIKAQELAPIELFFERWPNLKACFILPEGLSPEILTKIKQIPTGSTPLSFVLCENDTQLLINTKQKICLDQALIETLMHQNVSVHLSV